MTTFISYSRDNSAFAVRLAKDLKAAGFDVWLDQLDIPKGTRWDDEIEAAVEKSSTFMIVLAPESIESQNVKDELSYAIDAGKHILPVIIKPCKIPLRLRRFQHVDFTDQPYKESLTEIKRLLSNTQQIPRGAGEGGMPGEPKNIPTAFTENRQHPPATQPQMTPVKRPVAKSSNSRFVMPAVILVVLGLATAGILTVVRNGIFSSPPATPTSTATQELPTLTKPAPVLVPATSTEAVATKYYTEDFNNETFDWTQRMIKGIDQQVMAMTSNGSLRIDLSLYQDQEPYVLFVNEDYTYQDVQVEATVTNNGINDNKTILACRIGDTSWIAFEISNGGTYSIKVYDTTGKFKGGYKELAGGGSHEIKLGKVTNVYRAICQGTNLTLVINDTPVKTVDETTFNLTPTEGYVGLGADSPNKKYPISLLYDSLKVSQP